METVLADNPLKRAFRKFNAGRPARQPVDTPLGAVVLATEQRDRLARMLKDEGVEARHVSTVIIGRVNGPGFDGDLAEDIIVNEGSAHTALYELELHALQGRSFTVLGLTFLIETAEATDVVAYTVERTPEGCATLLSKTNEYRVQHRRTRET